MKNELITKQNKTQDGLSIIESSTTISKAGTV
jgi:hypothetical protein